MEKMVKDLWFSYMFINNVIYWNGTYYTIQPFLYFWKPVGWDWFEMNASLLIEKKNVNLANYWFMI